MLDFGAPYSERFANLVLKTLFLYQSQKGHALPMLTLAQLPSVLVLLDDEVKDLAQAMRIVRGTNKELVYLRYDREYEGWRDLILELQAIAEFVYEPKTLLVYLGLYHTFIRSEIFTIIAEQLKPETEFIEVPEQLTLALDNQPGVEFKELMSPYGNMLFSYRRS